MKLSNLIIPIRPTAEEELKGLDATQMGVRWPIPTLSPRIKHLILPGEAIPGLVERLRRIAIIRGESEVYSMIGGGRLHAASGRLPIVITPAKLSSLSGRIG